MIVEVIVLGSRLKQLHPAVIRPPARLPRPGIWRFSSDSSASLFARELGQRNGKVRVEEGTVTVLSRGCQSRSKGIEGLLAVSYMVRTGSSVEVVTVGRFRRWSHEVPSWRGHGRQYCWHCRGPDAQSISQAPPPLEINSPWLSNASRSSSAGL